MRAGPEAARFNEYINWIILRFQLLKDSHLSSHLCLPCKRSDPCSVLYMQIPRRIRCNGVSPPFSSFALCSLALSATVCSALRVPLLFLSGSSGSSDYGWNQVRIRVKFGVQVSFHGFGNLVGRKSVQLLDACSFYASIKCGGWVQYRTKVVLDHFRYWRRNWNEYYLWQIYSGGFSFFFLFEYKTLEKFGFRVALSFFFFDGNLKQLSESGIIWMLKGEKFQYHLDFHGTDFVSRMHFSQWSLPPCIS